LPTLLVVAVDLEQVLDRFGGPVALVQHLPPRMGIVEGDDDALARLRTAPGVLAVGDPDLPEAARASLTEAERLFLEGWVQGRLPKTRHGEGLPWDAPGYLPPDQPR
jgi:hypothetical protein